MDNFTKHYIIAALWSSSDTHPETGENLYLDDNFSIEDIAPCSIAVMQADCERFQRENAKILERAYRRYDSSGMSNHPDAGSPQACAGHDFWLTRNGHDVGFWARGFGPLGDQLTKTCETYPSQILYIGDDFRIYCE